MSIALTSGSRIGYRWLDLDMERTYVIDVREPSGLLPYSERH